MVVDQVLVMVLILVLVLNLILLLQRLKVIFLKNNLCFVPFKPLHVEVQVQSRALRYSASLMLEVLGVKVQHVG